MAGITEWNLACHALANAERHLLWAQHHVAAEQSNDNGECLVSVTVALTHVRNAINVADAHVMDETRKIVTGEATLPPS